MLSSFVYMLGFTAYLLGCGSQTRQPGAPEGQARVSDASAQTTRGDAGAHQAERDAGAGHASQELDSGHATSGCDDMQCRRQADDLAKTLETPALALSVKGGDCARVDIVDVVAGMACTCLTSNGWLYIGPKGAGCYARGRTGKCLWDDNEFDTCSAGDPACPAMCEELAKRYAADAAKSFDVEVRYSTCKENSCHYVLRIEKACYADHSFESGRTFDCQLSDPEILEREAKAQKSR